jgi:protein TonB
MNRKNGVYVILLTLALSSFSKESNSSVHYSATFQTNTTPPHFPGGDEQWRKFLEKNMNRDLPVENGASSGNYVAIVTFLIDANGNISEIKLLKNPRYGMGEEAVRLMKISPKWTPATKDGNNISYRQKQTFTWEISED